MDLQNFLEKFREQLIDVPPEDISRKTKFQELEDWSSLTTMIIIAFIATEYGKNISGNEIRNCNTIEDLFKLVENK